MSERRAVVVDFDLNDRPLSDVQAVLTSWVEVGYDLVSTELRGDTLIAFLVGEPPVDDWVAPPMVTL